MLESCYVSHYRNIQFRKEPTNRDQVKTKKPSTSNFDEMDQNAPQLNFFFILYVTDRKASRELENIISI